MQTVERFPGSVYVLLLLSTTFRGNLVSSSGPKFILDPQEVSRKAESDHYGGAAANNHRCARRRAQVRQRNKSRGREGKAGNNRVPGRLTEQESGANRSRAF